VRTPKRRLEYPDSPDWYPEQEAERAAERHRKHAHGGKECDCPPVEAEFIDEVPSRCGFTTDPASDLPGHDERCCMNGVATGIGPHPDCPGFHALVPEGQGRR